MKTLRAALGRYPHFEPLRDGRVRSDLIHVDFVDDHPKISQSFGATVNEQPWDVAELAIGAFLQAAVAAKPVKLLPVVAVGGFQHDCLRRFPSTEPFVLPESLKNSVIGVRSFSQTTGIWVRAILQHQYGVDLRDIRWLTFEGSHVHEQADPATATRATDGTTLLDALHDGRIAAAVVGPEATGTEPVIAGLEAAERAWFANTGVVNANHFVSVRSDIAADDMTVRELHRMFRESYEIALGAPSERTTAWGAPSPLQTDLARVLPAVELVTEYAREQGVITSPPPGLATLFAPASIEGGCP